MSNKEPLNIAKSMLDFVQSNEWSEISSEFVSKFNNHLNSGYDLSGLILNENCTKGDAIAAALDLVTEYSWGLWFSENVKPA
jgi:hypothetical protein